jgi:hypothetical protein
MAAGELSKKDVLEAKGHVDWTKERLCSDRERPEIQVVIVAPEASLHVVARPFAGGLYHVPPEKVLGLAKSIADNVRKLRVAFAGCEFAAAAAEFSAAMQGSGLDIPALRRVLLSSKLK